MSQETNSILLSLSLDVSVRLLNSLVLRHGPLWIMDTGHFLTLAKRLKTLKSFFSSIELQVHSFGKPCKCIVYPNVEERNTPMANLRRRHEITNISI